MRFFMRFRCYFAHKTCPSLPRTGFQSRNAATKYRQVSGNWEEGHRQIICDAFLSNVRDASRKEHSCRVVQGAFCTRNRIKNRTCKRALRQRSIQVLLTGRKHRTQQLNTYTMLHQHVTPEPHVTILHQGRTHQHPEHYPGDERGRKYDHAQREAHAERGAKQKVRWGGARWLAARDKCNPRGVHQVDVREVVQVAGHELVPINREMQLGDVGDVLQHFRQTGFEGRAWDTVSVGFQCEHGLAVARAITARHANHPLQNPREDSSKRAVMMSPHIRRQGPKVGIEHPGATAGLQERYIEQRVLIDARHNTAKTVQHAPGQ